MAESKPSACQSPRVNGVSRPSSMKVADLKKWKAKRHKQTTEPSAPFVASFRPNRSSKTFSRHTLRRRFRTACKSLGRERLEALTIHHGRHTFISHALAGHRTLAEVRDAAGHANVSITSAYLHVAVVDYAFYEWRKSDKQPVCISLKSGPIAFADLWETWHSPTGLVESSLSARPMPMNSCQNCTTGCR